MCHSDFCKLFEVEKVGVITLEVDIIPVAHELQRQADMLEGAAKSLRKVASRLDNTEWAIEGVKP